MVLDFGDIKLDAANNPESQRQSQLILDGLPSGEVFYSSSRLVGSKIGGCIISFIKKMTASMIEYFSEILNILSENLDHSLSYIVRI